MTNTIDRRDFVKTAGAAAAGVLFATTPSIAGPVPPKRRYAIVGTWTGIAARTGIEQKRPVRIAELVKF
jgi:hypothetical protein